MIEKPTEYRGRFDGYPLPASRRYSVATVEPAVFLDRDNTLIESDDDLGDPAGVRLMPGVPEGLAALREAGYRLIVVTNQGGVARGRFTEDDIDAVHQQVARLLSERAGGRDLIDRFYYCPYHPQATLEEYRRDHFWRKPNPGMILQAARDMKLDLTSSWVVGDQLRDVQAGRAAGCRTVLVGRNGEAEEARATATRVTPTFARAVEIILRDAHSNGPASAAGAPPAEPPAAEPVPARPARSPAQTATAAPDEHAAAATPAAAAAPRTADAELLRAVRDLTEELRHQRAHRVEFSTLRLAAGLAQLLAVLLAVLGALQLGNDPAAFTPWILGAIFVQGITLAMLLLDPRG